MADSLSATIILPRNPSSVDPRLFLEAKRHAYVPSNGPSDDCGRDLCCVHPRIAKVKQAITITDTKLLPGAKPESAE